MDLESLHAVRPLPAIAGREAELRALMQHTPAALAADLVAEAERLAGVQSCFACALHMHQPTIPAGADGALISHLQFMLEHPGEGDNHNAEPFAHCYRRLADLLPQLIAEGCNPQLMLDYSGTLLWGFEQMGRHDILDALRYLSRDAQMQRHVEWLGSFWGHAVAPSTPIPDLRLQIQAWQHQFAALFGDEALQRVRGFSPPEMHLPNHPDTLYALVEALLECGYTWLLVQEHSVENLDGSPLQPGQALLPQRLVARNSAGDSLSIAVLIKTQGSDTKLIGQMQPYFEALGYGRQQLAGQSLPALVSQIADGENGGVMMNEFPPAFCAAHRRIRDSGGDGASTVAVNGTAYLSALEQAGLQLQDLTAVQPVLQHRLWQHLQQGDAGLSVDAAIASLQSQDPGFAMSGASWTNNLSWVEGYANVLEPMQQLSAAFHQLFDPLLAADPGLSDEPLYQQALLHLLLLETSCFRYWGQGLWTDYAREIHRRALAHLEIARRQLQPA